MKTLNKYHEGIWEEDGKYFCKCDGCGDDLELQINDFNDPQGDFYGICDKNGEQCCAVDFHASDPLYFEKYSNN